MITSRAEQELLATWWHAQYIAAARDSFPDICGDLELAVGFKLTSPSGKSYNNYYWPLVDGLYDEPRLHEATAWNPKNSESCPRAVGDGLCVATTITAAQSGGARFSTSAGHVLVYPATLAMSDTDGKWRVPWCVDVDCFTAQELIVAGCMSSADLGSADLRYANLRYANLRYANLGYANLRSANANQLTLWPTGFDHAAAGVIVEVIS